MRRSSIQPRDVERRAGGAGGANHETNFIKFYALTTLTITPPPYNLVLADRLMLLSLSKGSRPGGGAARRWAP